MYSIEIRAIKGNNIRDYQFCHISQDIFRNDALFDVTVGFDKTKLREFRSKTVEENLRKLADHLIDSGHKVIRVKPVTDDWTLSKLLINTLHDIKMRKVIG